MGLFKSKEEKISERKEWKRRITDGPMTQMILNTLLEKYRRLDFEEMQKLRKTNIGNCRLKVENAGFIVTLRDILHLTVLDAGCITYNTDRPRYEW